VNEIQSKITKFVNIRKKSINHCLVVLGANHKEVYCDFNDKFFKQPHRASNRTIYDKFGREELLAWVEYLYIEALKKYHPDKHLENPRLYTEICQELGRAYLQAKNILNKGRK
jgi:hypothetical protein